MHRIRFDLVLFGLMLAQSSLVIAVGQFSQVAPDAQIAPNAVIGSFVVIADGVYVSAYSRVGDFAIIGTNSRIGENTEIREHVIIGPHVTIAENCKIFQHATIGSNVVIDANTQISQHNSIGDGAVIRQGVVLNAHVAIGNSADIGRGSFVAEHARLGIGARTADSALIDRHANVGDDATIMEQAYIGSHTLIGSRHVIGKHAVILEYASVLDGVAIPDRQVVIGAPSTQMLLNIITATPVQCRSTSASNQESGLDSTLRILVDQQWTELIEQCQDPNSSNPIRMTVLPCIVREYLVAYYGEERFNQLLDQQRFGIRDADQHDLFQTYHFGPMVEKQILSPNGTHEVALLLALEKDTRRELRTHGDIKCLMISEIHDDRRHVVVKMPPINQDIVVNTGNYNNNQNVVINKQTVIGDRFSSSDNVATFNFNGGTAARTWRQ